MNRVDSFDVLVFGWDRDVVEQLWQRIAARSALRFFFVSHPREVPDAETPRRASNTHFLFAGLDCRLPEPDEGLLHSLEQPGVPTIHNMILGDRVVRKLGYRDALRYATFLAKRVQELITEVSPSVVIGSFDALHSGITMAVAQRMGVPWFAMNFSVIPPGLTCLCNRMEPAARVQITSAPKGELRARAEMLLENFERRAVRVPAYVTPPPLSLTESIRKLPSRLSEVAQTRKRARAKSVRRFTDLPGDYSVVAAVRHLWRVRAARRALAKTSTVASPPSSAYVLFGLHMQPESSIDVWAPFFSNQMWVIELIARSLPPTHKLLVKIHKSDAAHYPKAELRHMLAFPGVELVEPFVSARDFIESADLVVAIQGTMGLEAAMLGKAVIMLGESPVSLFPSVSCIGKISDLPEIIRMKLAERSPERNSIVDAYAKYLEPFMQASHNDWQIKPTDMEIDAYVAVFDRLREHLRAQPQVRLSGDSPGPAE